jgi:exodeoxyribonuclease VII large subunit
MNEAGVNVVEWTVSELSAAVKRSIEDAYGFVRVRGEISGFRGAHSSGHCYFSLKDESAKIEAVIWKTAFARMRIKPEEGLEVIVSGRLTTYPGQSKYQIVVETLEPAGLGALMALIEERKKKLAAEGLFDAARKQLLPFLPDVIGVVTSPTCTVWPTAFRATWWCGRCGCRATARLSRSRAPSAASTRCRLRARSLDPI